MSKAAARQDATAGSARSAPPGSPRRAKLAAFLVTADVELWPQVGAHLPAKLNFRQLDSVGELLSEVPSETPAVVLWDARDCAAKGEQLSRIQSHSACFAMLVLDDDASEWASAIQTGQIVGLVPVPIDQSRLIGALGGAYEEVNARVALLGEKSAAPDRAGGGGRVPWMAIAAAVAIAASVAAVLMLWRHGGGSETSAKTKPADPQSRSPAAGTSQPPRSATAASEVAQPPSPSEERVDALIDQAQRAMRDRHFIDPVEGSALALYRNALVLDPSSGEARQGLQRLSEVLLARVQTALDERQFDAALQALENARSIDPADNRLSAFDERIARMRAELGPAEILAAINAKNFDRAAQLIDQAARARSIGEPRLNQLREDLRQHRTDSDDSRLVGLIDARIQQDQLIEPPNDSAVYYLSVARRAGATSAALQSQFRELSRRLMLAARTDIAQQQLDEADRIAADLRSIGVPLSQVAALQHDIGVARAQRAAAAAPEPPQVAQTQIVAQSRAALDASQPNQAESPPQPAGPAAPATGPQQVAEASLTRTRPLEIDYPLGALSKQIEGQVEVGYVVTPKGAVSDLKVLTAAPSGVFEKAATNAVSRLRYKPVMDAGKPVAVSTKMLVIFRLAK